MVVRDPIQVFWTGNSFIFASRFFSEIQISFSLFLPGFLVPVPCNHSISLISSARVIILNFNDIWRNLGEMHDVESDKMERGIGGFAPGSGKRTSPKQGNYRDENGDNDDPSFLSTYSNFPHTPHSIFGDLWVQQWSAITVHSIPMLLFLVLMGLKITFGSFRCNENFCVLKFIATSFPF